MKRRHFLLSGTASAALALTGCGGGGGASAEGNLCAAPTGSTNASTLAAPATRIAATASGLGYPFGARLAPYAAGTKPAQSSATMDSLLTKQYDAWKAARIVSVVATWIIP